MEFLKILFLISILKHTKTCMVNDEVCNCNFYTTSIEISCITLSTTSRTLELDDIKINNTKQLKITGMIFQNKIYSRISVKTNLTSELTSLTLENNEINGIHANSFLYLSKLTMLSLKSNKIVNIEKCSFHGLTNLLNLYLQMNNMNVIKSETFD